MKPIPRRPLGRTGVEVTILGLGGEGVLRTHGREAEAVALIRRAIELGITYFDCAKAYAGSEGYYGKALEGGLRDKIFLCSKSADRTKAGALRDLESTLATMRTDRLDLWQVHDVRTEDDLERIFSMGGAIEAFEAAKKAGKVRFIGVTGHFDPRIISKAIERHPFDTVLLPVNAAEPHYLSFLETTLPLAASRGLGIIGMKVVRGFVGLGPHTTASVERRLSTLGLSLPQLLRFALSQPVSLAIVGCETLAELEENVGVAKVFEPLKPAEVAQVLARTRPLAAHAQVYKRGAAAAP